MIKLFYDLTSYFIKSTWEIVVKNHAEKIILIEFISYARHFSKQTDGLSHLILKLTSVAVLWSVPFYKWGDWGEELRDSVDLGLWIQVIWSMAFVAFRREREEHFLLLSAEEPLDTALLAVCLDHSLGRLWSPWLWSCLLGSSFPSTQEPPAHTAFKYAIQSFSEHFNFVCFFWLQKYLLTLDNFVKSKNVFIEI